MGIKKCYIYTRVSTAAQIEGYSLEAQQEKLRRYAEYKGLKIAGEYCDAGKSGKSINGRPAFREMLEDISSEKDQISYVLVFKLSRFGRNAADILKSMQLLTDYDVDLVCVEDAIDSSTQGGRLTLAILSAVAEIERENIQVQFTAGREQKLMEGGWPGGPVPYGYRLVDKELVQEPEEAKIVKLVYDMYLQEGMNGYTIIRWLNDNGFSRMVKGEKRPFNSDSIINMLKNPIYNGTIMYNRRTNRKDPQVKMKPEIAVQGRHEPIVSKEQWELVQDKKQKISAARIKNQEPDRISLLSGIVKCPGCGNGLVASASVHKNRKKGGYYKKMHYYSCRGYRKTEGRICNFGHTYNQEIVDHAVLEIIERIPGSKRFTEAVNRAIGDQPTVERLQEQLKEVRKKLHKNEHLKYKLGEILDNLDVFSEDYGAEYDRIQKEIDETYEKTELLETEIYHLKKKLLAVSQGIYSVDKVNAILNNFHLLYAEMDDYERRDLCRLFMERIELYPEEQADGKIIKSIAFCFPIYYSLDGEDESDEPDEEVAFEFDCSDAIPTVAEAKATYAEIKKYVLERFGLKVSSLYIARIKRKYGLEIGEAYNKPSDPKKRVPKCPKEKELAILEALKAFRMLEEEIEYME